MHRNVFRPTLGGTASAPHCHSSSLAPRPPAPSQRRTWGVSPPHSHRSPGGSSHGRHGGRSPCWSRSRSTQKPIWSLDCVSGTEKVCQSPQTGSHRATRQTYLLRGGGQLGSTGVECQRRQRTVVSRDHVRSSLEGKTDVPWPPRGETTLPAAPVTRLKR